MNSRKLSVLFIVPSLQGGGAERVMLTLLRHLDRDAFQLRLAVIDGQDAVLAAELPGGMEVVFLGHSRVRYSVAGLLRLIRDTRPDVVFSILGHLNLLLALMKPLFPRGTRLVVRETIVVSANLESSRFPGFWKIAYRRLMPKCDAIVCQSDDMRQDLAFDIGVPNDKMTVLQNPVDIARIRSRRNERAVLECGERKPLEAQQICLVAAGRLVWQKGFDTLLESMALLNNPRYHLTIIGQGILRDQLQRQSQELGLTKQVRLAGFQANPYPLFRSADAFVLSSRFEGMPNVVLEALACGTGVIALPAPGGIRELLQGRPHCTVAASMSARSLADALQNYDFGSAKPQIEFELSEYAAPSIAARYAKLFQTITD